jgi:hypothetical protein
MKRVPAVLAAFVLAASIPAFASAQTPSGLTGGVKGGITFGDIPKFSEQVEGDGVDAGKRTGLAIGGFVTIPFDKLFAFQVEGLYTQKGFHAEGGGEQGTFKFDYIDIPLLLRMQMEPEKGLYALVGPSLNFNVAAKIDIEGSPVEDIKDEVESFEAAFVAAVGYQIRQLAVEFRYMEGLTNIVKDSTETFKTRTYAVLGSFRFK